MYTFLMKITEKKVRNCLEMVMDPELNMSIVDLGLIYSIKVDSNNNVDILMTLTTIGCPLFDTIESDMRNKLKKIKAEKINITLTFEPPWTIENMSERGKAILGI